MKVRWLWVLLWVVGLVACGDVGEAPVYEIQRQSAQPIMGGSNDSDHPSVVGLVIDFGGGGYAICSGTLIAPNLVLTAQHCIASHPNGPVYCNSSRFGNVYAASGVTVTTRPQLSNNQGDYYQAAQIHVPDGQRTICGEDIALVVLSQNVPASEAAPIIPRIDADTSADERYTALGYGHVGNFTGDGVRRILGNRRVQCEGQRCPDFSEVQGTEFLGTGGTCEGDSGGPAIDEQGRVLGALSRGSEGCSDSIYSAVSGWSDWMRQIGRDAAQRGGYEAPRWVRDGSSEPGPPDADGDGIADTEDNCPLDANPDQADSDGNGLGDRCEPDHGPLSDPLGPPSEDMEEDPGPGAVTPDPDPNSPGDGEGDEGNPQDMCADPNTPGCWALDEGGSNAVDATTCSAASTTPRRAPLGALALMSLVCLMRVRTKRRADQGAV